MRRGRAAVKVTEGVIGVIGVTPSLGKWEDESRKVTRKVSHGVLYRTRDTVTPSAFPMLRSDPPKMTLSAKVSEGVMRVTPSCNPRKEC